MALEAKLRVPFAPERVQNPWTPSHHAQLFCYTMVMSSSNIVFEIGPVKKEDEQSGEQFVNNTHFN